MAVRFFPIFPPQAKPTHNEVDTWISALADLGPVTKDSLLRCTGLTWRVVEQSLVRIAAGHYIHELPCVYPPGMRLAESFAYRFDPTERIDPYSDRLRNIVFPRFDIHWRPGLAGDARFEGVQPPEHRIYISKRLSKPDHTQRQSNLPLLFRRTRWHCNWRIVFAVRQALQECWKTELSTICFEYPKIPPVAPFVAVRTPILAKIIAVFLNDAEFVWLQNFAQKMNLPSEIYLCAGWQETKPWLDRWGFDQWGCRNEVL